MVRVPADRRARAQSDCAALRDPDLEEARAYLAHPVLGPRLRECAAALVGLDATDPEQSSASIDAVKLRSSMTLFAHADPDEPLFGAVLEEYFAGARDEATTSRL